jgi:ketosteroid isomerase-like protein
VTAQPELLSGAELGTMAHSEDAWNRGDLDAMLAHTPEHAEWVIAEENPGAARAREAAGLN